MARIDFPGHVEVYSSDDNDMRLIDLIDGTDYYWDYPSLSENPNITLQDVLSRPFRPWREISVSSNPSVTLQDIEDNPQYPWIETGLSKNPNITLQYVLDHPGAPPQKDVYSEHEWGWYKLSSNPGISFSEILDHQDLPWNWEIVLERPDINLYDVVHNLKIDLSKYIFNLSKNPKVTRGDIFENPYEIKWEWNGVIVNPNINIDDIYAHPEIPWDPERVTLNPNFSAKDIVNHPDISPAHKSAELYRNASFNDLIKYRFFLSNIGRYSRHSQFTIDEIKDGVGNYDKYRIEWDWYDLSQNENISMQDVIENPDLPWEYGGMSSNPNLTIKYVYDNPDNDWDVKALSINKFGWKSQFEPVKSARKM